MRSTLFLIPHAVGGWPLFGVGLLLAGLVVGCVAWVVWLLATKRDRSDVLATLPVWGVAALIVVFVLPNVEQRLPDGTPLGLPIRGYGVMVLLGLLAGIGITIVRGQRLKIAADVVIGLGFWMMLGGVLGARLFYVAQKWSEFDYLTFGERLVAALKLTEGGLVIYGGVLGGLVAGTLFCWRQRLNVASTADLIAPGFLIGLSIGRIGCLLHGCCFGGVCTADLPAIQFPKGSGPYQAQLATGELLGIHLEERRRPPGAIAQVDEGSPADQADIQAGQSLEALEIGLAGQQEEVDPLGPPPLRADALVSGKRYSFLPPQLPERSLPAHPSQIYASINALLLCLLIWQIQPLPPRDGMAFLIAIVLYALSRFLLEGVRSDEGGQLGTVLTISQLIAVFSGAGALIGLGLLYRLPPRRVWAWR